MRKSRRWGVIAATAGALCLLANIQSLAQEAAPEPEPSSETAESREVLEGMVDVRNSGNQEAAAVQKRIDGVSDETDDLVSQYRTTLKQIDAIDLYNSQMRGLVAAQKDELASLEDQLDRVEIVGRSVTPLMLLMIDAVEKFVDLDVPFLIDERKQRVADLRKMMGRPDVTTAEKFRQIMEAYQIENEYGRTIESYRGTLELEGRETVVDFLRFGRIALVYQSLDETASGVWDKQNRTWVALDASYRSAIRQGLRIARKQAAPDLITLPLPAPTSPRREG
ncbi:MAG: DUF3450 domain-containing protein [Myxococcota bacterium]|nr:DUF3450 domain-containing protein [Myxococcota bacterium]